AWKEYSSTIRRKSRLPPPQTDKGPEDASRFGGYEITLEHAAFLALDLVRTIEAVFAAQRLHGCRRGEHAIGRTGGFQARGDVDGIAPHIISEFARADHSGHDRAGMQSHPDRERNRQPRPQPRGRRNHVEREFRRQASM